MGRAKVQMTSKVLDVENILSAIDVSNSRYTSAPPSLRIGQIHLKLGSLEDASLFYGRLIGFECVALAEDTEYLSSGRYHHHLGLNGGQSAGAGKRDENGSGLAWFSVEMEDPRLEIVQGRLARDGRPIQEISNGIETMDPWNTKVRLLRVRQSYEDTGKSQEQSYSPGG